MREQLQLLEELQEIDNQIDAYQKDLERLPMEVQEIARSLVQIRRETTEIKEKLTVLEKDQRKKEQDLAIEQEKIKKSERRLLSIKNQKEYNALSREIKLGKKVAGEIEDSLLTIMSQTESNKKNLEKKEKEYQGLESDLLERKSLAEEKTSEAEHELQSLTSKRNEIAEGIERDYLKRYATVRKARGKALAELNHGSCTGCHMAIPAQLNIRVLKQEEMIICPNCNRILYVKPENIPDPNKMDA